MTADRNIGIAVMGCGAMGSELALAVGPDGIQNARVEAVFDADADAAGVLAQRLPGGVPAISEMADLVTMDSVDLVVECAGQAAVKAHGDTILDAGKSLLIMSSGALLDPEVFTRVTTAASTSGGDIIVPSGAVGGIDALRACRGHLDSVTIVSTKKPESLRGAPGFAAWEDVPIPGPTVVFEGPASAAVDQFPANVNVAATVSLAGIGPQATQVKVIADPDAPGNVHQIDASGPFGELSFRCVNRPYAANPKTSHLAALAAIEALRTYCEPGPRLGT